MIRRLHRWVAIVAAGFLIYLAITGMLLAADGLVVRFSRGFPPDLLKPGWPWLPHASGDGPIRAEDPAVALRAEDVQAMIAGALRAAARLAPADRVVSIELRRTARAPTATLVMAGPAPTELVVDTASGAWLNRDAVTRPPERPYIFSLRVHQILKRLHRGDIIGVSGRWMIVLTGLSLLFLSGSALVMYTQMWRARRRMNRGGVFW